MADKPGNEWIEWGGGKCPVDPDTLVTVRLGIAGDEEDPGEALCYLWHHEPDAVAGDYHLTAYRVVP